MRGPWRLLLLISPSLHCRGLSIDVCQNKDCRRRFQSPLSLPSVVEDLLEADHVVVMRTGCLTHCDKGPNVCVRSAQGEETIRYGVVDREACVALLQDMDQPPPTKLAAAVSVMERTLRGGQDPEKMYSSILRALNDDDALSRSSARIHAQLLRAESRCDAGRFAEALEDCTLVQELTRDDQKIAQAYRVAARAHESLGQVKAAMEAIRQWARCDPSFATKAAKELHRLSSKVTHC